MAVTIAGAAAGACDRGVNTATARGSVAEEVPRVVINEVMANPRRANDVHGEWIELYNVGTSPVNLRGWTIASGNDRGAVIDRSVVVPGGSVAVLARDADRSANGGVTAAFAYGSGVALGNGADWLALRMPDGSTVDSVAWTSAIAGASRELVDAGAPHAEVTSSQWRTATSAFGLGDLGTPGRANDRAVQPGTPVASTPARQAPAAATPSSGAPRVDSAGPARDSTLVVRVLDVGQGDAILIENGGSRVLIDGGPDRARFARLLDQYGIPGSTVDVVILTHQHYDHHAGLGELFRSRRHITVRYLFENKDPYSNVALAALRDSIIARANRGQLIYRDSDDPCGTGAATCTVTLRGGAKLRLLRPDPRGDGPNNRSMAVKLVAADSAAFTMWLAGDAEQQEIRWFDETDYDRSPGMRALVLKADHHGSCDGISSRYLDLVRPEIVVMSLAANNDYGDVHSQTLALLRSRRIPWYRTDQNGTITITAPARSSSTNGKGYSVAVERGGPNMTGPVDRRARGCGEAGAP